MLVQPLSNVQARLLAASAQVIEHRADALLQAFGEHEQFRSDSVVAVDVLLIHMSHTVDGHMDVPMRVAVAHRIRFALEFFGQLLFHRLMHTPRRHLLQHALDVLGSIAVAVAGVPGVACEPTVAGARDLSGVMRGNTRGLFGKHALDLDLELLGLLRIRNEAARRRHRLAFALKALRCLRPLILQRVLNRLLVVFIVTVTGTAATARALLSAAAAVLGLRLLAHLVTKVVKASLHHRPKVDGDVIHRLAARPRVLVVDAGIDDRHIA